MNQLSAHARKSPSDRLRETANRLFAERGANVSLREIAHWANTREETAIRLFGDINGLLEPYVSSLITKAHSLWQEAKIDQPPSRELHARVAHFGQVLRTWVELVERE